MSSNTLARTSFYRPDAAHSPAAYWFWHKVPTEEEVRRQVRDMHDGGFLTFLIQCRLAFPRDQYLDDQYFAAYRTAVDEAEKLGMQVGVYDEYNWQSGLAGGRTVRGADHLREQHIFWATCPATSLFCSLWISDIHSSVEGLGEAAMFWQYEDGHINWTDWGIVSAFLHPAHDAQVELVKDMTQWAQIGFSSSSSCRIDVSLLSEVPEDTQITVFVAARCSTSRVPNYLMKETARRFIEVNYEPYRTAFAKYFGTTIGYFFFDQPHASFYHWPNCHGNLLSSLPFAPEIVRPIESVTGYSFTLTLLALIMEIGPDTGIMRANFYEAFSRLMMHNCLEPLQSWTAKQGLYLSGHEVLGHVGTWHPHGAFANWDLRVNFGLDYFGVDAYRGETCVDAEGLRSQLAAKMGDSVARSSGRTGCRVEQYFVNSELGDNQYAGMWDLSLEQLRAQAFRLHLSGAKQFIFHGFYQSDGNPNDFCVLRNPRFDFAPGVNFEPWWPFHRAFAEESARLSIFIDEASPECELAIFYPLRTAWAEGPMHSYGDHMQFWSAFLAERGYGYHFIDEGDLIEARINGRFLCIGARQYQALVLPSVTTLDSALSLSMVEGYLAAGGTVIASGETPVRYQHSVKADAASTWASLVLRYKGIRSFSAIPSSSEADYFIRPLVAGRPYVVSHADLLRQWVGHDESGWRIAIFNDHSNAVKATVELPFAVDGFEIWNVSDGDIRSVATPLSCQLELHLDSMELLCLFIPKKPNGDLKSSTTLVWPEVVENLLKNCEVIPLFSGWTLCAQDRSTFFETVNVTNGWEKQGLPYYSGIGTYNCQFDVSNTGGRWYLYLPSVNTAVMVELNGEKIGQKAWSPYIFLLPSGLIHSQNTLRLYVFNTAANRYFGGTPFGLSDQNSGILDVPQLLWQDDNSLS